MAKFPKPNYKIWDGVNRFDESEVTCLWAELEPSQDALQHPRVLDNKRRLEEARQNDLLHHEVEKTTGDNRKFDYRVWYWRQDLIEHANNNQEQPAFLFPENRIVPSLPTIPVEDNEEGLKKVEKKIRAILEFAKEFEYEPLAIPNGGKAKLKIKCMTDRVDIFGTGKYTFDEGWRGARKQNRIQMANHEMYVGNHRKAKGA